MRRLLGLALLGAGLLPGMALGQAAPPAGETLRIIAGFSPGGTSDIMARLMAEAMAPVLGQRVLVENRTGANGFIAAEAVARGPVDGSVVFQCPMGTMTISPELPGLTLPVDPGQDLIPVANATLSRYGVAVGARSPYRSLQDVLAEGRKRPGALSYASAGGGSAQHLSGERLSRMAGLQLLHVPYRGAAPAMLDVIAGRADLIISNLGDMIRQVEGGELRLLAVGDSGELEGYPGLAKLPEVVPGLEVVGWFGFCGPRGMAPEAVARWSGAVRTALENPELRKKLLGNGLTPLFEDQAAFGARMARDRRLWGETIRAAGIRAD